MKDGAFIKIELNHDHKLQYNHDGMSMFEAIGVLYHQFTKLVVCTMSENNKITKEENNEKNTSSGT